MAEPAWDSTDDFTFRDRFERCEIELSEWDHRAHQRVTYAYLRDIGYDAALESMRTGVQRFNASKGIEDTLESGYHDTLTCAWVRIIDTTMRVHGPEAHAEAFLDRHTQLHSKVLLRLFYSRERIMSWEAKRGFMEPDLAPLPRVPGECG